MLACKFSMTSVAPTNLLFLSVQLFRRRAILSLTDDCYWDSRTVPWMLGFRILRLPLRWWWILILSASLSLTTRCLEAGERDDQGTDELSSNATEADHLIDVVPPVEAEREDLEHLVPV